MRRVDDIMSAKQRMIEWQGLNVEHVGGQADFIMQDPFEQRLRVANFGSGRQNHKAPARKSLDQLGCNQVSAGAVKAGLTGIGIPCSDIRAEHMDKARISAGDIAGPDNTNPLLMYGSSIVMSNVDAVADLPFI
jgi:hypothetical protein